MGNEWRTKSFYLVCTVGFAWILEAQTEEEVLKQKERLHKMGYKRVLIYHRAFGLSIDKLLGKA